MQQQIWEEEQVQALPQIDELVQQQKYEPEQPEQKTISEHYEQDFDPIEQSLNKHFDPEIQEDLSQAEEPKVIPQAIAFTQQPDQDDQEQKLREECRLMQSNIAHMKSQIEKYQQKLKEENQIYENSEQVVESLLEMKKANQYQLQKQRVQLNSTVSSRFGRDPVSLGYLLKDGQMVEGKFLEEKLMQEIVRINALLHCTNIQIGKLKLSVKKNGDQLQHVEDSNEQLHKKYRQLYRQAQQRKQKLLINQQKQRQANGKIQQLQEKLSQIKNDKGDQLLEISSLKKRVRQYEELNKLKQTEIKRIHLTKNSCCNSCTSLSRLIADLRKQTQEIYIQISQIQSKNGQLQSKSQLLLSSYHQRQPIHRYRYQHNVNHFSQPQQQLQPLRSPSVSLNKMQINRPRNYSVQKKIGTHKSRSNVYFSADSNIPFKGLTGTALDAELSANDSIINELQSKLRECSTDGILRKQFKLKLPTNKHPLGSRKFIDTHSIPNEINYRNTGTKRQQSKLSVSERIERIQILQRQDKIHAHKSNSNSRVIMKQRPALSLYEPILPQPKIDLSTPTRKQQENAIIQQGRKQETVKIKSKSNLLKTTSELQQQSEKILTSPMRKSQLIYPQLQISTPQNLFSSIKQKLTMRQSSALGSFKVDNPDNTSEYLQSFCNDSTLGMSRLRHTTFMKKRSSTVREKKITDQYMRLLEQKGRRILQLDNQGQN